MCIGSGRAEGTQCKFEFSKPEDRECPDKSMLLKKPQFDNDRNMCAA